MLTLNREAAVHLEGFEVHAVTDITGFGLLGHAFEMATASGVCLKMEAAKVPLITGVERLAKRGFLPGGVESNRHYLGEAVQWGNTRPLIQKLLLDPQTSGGLLIGLPPDQASGLLEKLEAAQVFGQCIGAVVNRSTHYLSVQ